MDSSSSLCSSFCSIHGMKKRVEIMKQKTDITRGMMMRAPVRLYFVSLLWCHWSLTASFFFFSLILFVIKGLHSILFPFASDCSQSNWGWKVFLFSRNREALTGLSCTVSFSWQNRIDGRTISLRRRRKEKKKREGEDESQGFFLLEHHHDVGGEDDWRKETGD